MIIKWAWFLEVLSKINGFRVTGFTFMFIVLIRDLNDSITINHEKIHLKQNYETFFVFFYIVYAINYIINRFKGMNHFRAYNKILFENEAYKFQNDLGYLKQRPCYNWLRI